MAPASNAPATSRSMACISSSVGSGLSGSAITPRRIVLCPTCQPTLKAVPSATRSR